MKPRIAAAPVRIGMAQGRQITQAPRISATPRLRGSAWMKRRAIWLRTHPLCVHCEAEGITARAEEVDHIKPLWDGGVDSEANYQGLCREHHKAKTALEAAERAKAGITGDRWS